MLPSVTSPQTASAVGDAVRHTHVETEGGTLHVLEQGSGPAVLFCHGFPDTATTWRSQMQAVADAGFRAVALDMRGFGQSLSPADPALYSALHVVGDLVAVLDALGIEQAVLVGHDWGADHAQRAIVMRPDRFRGIVSLSIPFAPRGDESTWHALRKRGLGNSYYAFAMMREGAGADFEPAASSIPRILYWLSGSPAEGTGWDPIDPARHMLRPAPDTLPDWATDGYVKHTIDAFARGGFEGGLNHYRGAQATFDLMAAWKNVPILQPSLYIWGAEDGLCQLFHSRDPDVEELLRVQPGLVDQIRLDGVGHWPQHEAADRVGREIVAFLHGLDDRIQISANDSEGGAS